MVQAYTNYGSGSTMTPQSMPIPGREAQMQPNNAGGVGFALNDWARLERFLILGSEGGSYYVGERKLTEQHAACVIRCIRQNGVRVVEMAHDVNVANRAPKTDQQLFALALAMKHGDEVTKHAVAFAAPAMLRIGTHLLHFVAMLDSLGGWSRSKRRIVARWFQDQSADALAFQAVKYQTRDGFSMRDALRLSHPKAQTPEHAAVYDAICNRDNPHMPRLLRAYADAHGPDGTDAERALVGIAAGLPREALPTAALNEPDVWRAMLPDMPLHALLRNLGNLSACGVLALGSPECATVAAKLADAEALLKSRVHPFAVLLATLVYKRGAGFKGSKTWTPVPSVLSALEDAYDKAFANVTPTGKRMLIGIDISNSMTTACMGTPVPASTAAAAVAITLARMEPNALVVQFDTAVQRIVPVTARTGIASLEDARGGGTDVASPVQWASGVRSERRRFSLVGYSGFATQLEPTGPQVFDAFVILTDDETWAGSQHPSQALEVYRKQVSTQARLVCCSMAANHTSIVDPDDPLSLGCAGLDASIPALVTEFLSR